jgi:NitT/TauT family transport system permease protein
MSERRRTTWIGQVLWPTLVFVCFLACWHFAVVGSRTKVFPSPLSVAKGMAELDRKGLLWSYTLASLGRVGTGFALAVLTGVPLGFALGWYPKLARVVSPTIELLRPISPIAWIPVAILFFGIGDKPAIFLIFLGAFFPIVIACADGVSRVPAAYRQAGRNFGLSNFNLLRRVVLPASFPQILAGLRLAFGIAWLVVVAAEMVAVNSGLGYLVIDSRNAGKRYDLVVAAMVLIGAIGLILDTLFRSLEKLNSVRWGFRQ